VLLTTQYLEEADRLADDIAVIAGGRLLASGTPDALKARVGTRLDVVVAALDALGPAAVVLAGLARRDAAADPDRRRVSVPVAAGALTLTDVVRALDAAGVVAEDVALHRPTLDEVFLRLTGPALEGAHR
jgi:ABC-2 type transport system ATP-binding protein